MKRDRFLTVVFFVAVAVGLAIPAVARNQLQTLEVATGKALVAVGSTGFVTIAAGTNGDVLTADSSTASGAKWATPSSGSACSGYPVGSIMITTSSTNPGTSLGCGTWTAFGTGRVPVGFDSGNVAFDTDEETGGALTVASAGSVAAPTLSGSTAAESAHTHAVVAAGTVAAPTLSGSTAAESAHTHGVTSNVAVADHSYTPAGTNSAPTFTGSALATHSHELPLQIVSATSIRILPSATFGAGTSRAAGGALTPTSSTTSAAVALSEAKSAGTPAGTVTAPTFTGNGATLTHSVTNNAVTSAAGSSHLHAVGTLAASAPAFTGSSVSSGAGSSHLHAVGTLAASAPAYTGSSTSVVQPYIVVRMWKRTA